MPLTVTDFQLQQCSNLLSCDEHARVERFQFERDRRRYAVARGTLRVLLGNYVGMSPETIAFEPGRHGKPYITNAPIPVHFNLSHCTDLAMYAISRTYVPGVDIECLDRDVDHEGISRKFFSTRECAELQRLPAADRQHAFLTCWTRKEAIVKAMGDGLSMALDQIEVTVASDTQLHILSIPQGAPSDWTLHTVDAGTAYAATVALHRVG